MAQTIMMICMLIITIALFASYQSAAGIRKNQRMNTTLPDEDLKHPKVIAVIESFKKSNIVLLLASIALTLPILFIKPTSLQITYITVWTGINFIISNHLYCKYNAKLIMLKSENRWFPNPYLYHEMDGTCQIRKGKVLKRLFPSTMDRMLKNSDAPIYVDEDEYWINGYYYNPKDRKSTVEKRVGVGTTGNLAAKGGSLTIYGSMIFVVVLMGSLIFLFVWMDFATFQMEIGDSVVEIEAPLYDYEFQLSDVTEISLSDTLPEGGVRTNGAATSTYYLGNFRFNSYGNSKVYLYKGYPPYIIIKLKDKTVFFNTKSKEETLDYYNKLLESIEKIDLHGERSNIKASLSVLKLSEEDFQYIGTSGVEKEDFRKVNFQLNVDYNSRVTNRKITVPDLREVMNSYDIERYWYGNSTKSDNPKEDVLYANDIMFYTKGLDNEGIEDVFDEAQVRVTWTDEDGSEKEEIVNLAEIIEFE